jgi:hypothetical protein
MFEAWNSENLLNDSFTSRATPLATASFWHGVVEEVVVVVVVVVVFSDEFTPNPSSSASSKLVQSATYVNGFFFASEAEEALLVDDEDAAEEEEDAILIRNMKKNTNGKRVAITVKKRKMTVGTGFQIGGKFVRGLCPTLAKHFFPFFVRSKARPHPNTSVVAQRSKPFIRRQSGLQLGRKIDTEVQIRGQFCIRHGLGPECFAGLSLPIANLAGKEAHQMRELWKSTHDYSRRFFHTLVRWGLDIVGVQTVVGSAAHNLATAVDVVCRDKHSGGLVIVELKTGFDSYYEHFCGHLLSPFSDKFDSPHNQHQLQLGFTAQMYASQTQHDVTGFVVRIHKDGESVYPLESWVRENIRLAFEAIMKK